MNLLLAFSGFIIAFIIVLYYERKIRRTEPRNKVHFYVARDANGLLCRYSGKPKRSIQVFFVGSWGEIITSGNGFSNYGLDVNDYANLKFEDEPVEVFLNLEN